MNINANPEFDAIVVGTGPGGATVARDLTKSRKKVLILEWGDSERTKGTMFQSMKRLGVPGKGFLITNNMLSMVRGITTGGSSIFYYGTAFTPPLDMMKSYGIDIALEMEELRRELPIAPLSDELIGPMAARIMESARSIGYRWDRLSKFIYQDRCRPGCGKCNYGCPHEAKWNGSMFVNEAVSKGAAFHSNARVSKVIIDNKKAVGVQFTMKGKEMKAYASKIIIAAGGIGSPKILRDSGIKGAGYDYFFDPLICVMGTVKDIRGGHEIPMAAGHQFVEDGYVMTDMTIPAGLYIALASQVFRINRLFSHPRTLGIMVKAKDTLGGRLTDGGGVRKRMADIDYRKLDHGYERAKNILRRAGAKNIFKSWYMAAHPGGTVKINHLVDNNLQTEYQNLYVCDCSVIPEAWGLPPTYTILCLARRLAKQLVGIA